jgi:hypothetical protein
MSIQNPNCSEMERDFTIAEDLDPDGDTPADANDPLPTRASAPISE